MLCHCHTNNHVLILPRRTLLLLLLLPLVLLLLLLLLLPGHVRIVSLQHFVLHVQWQPQQKMPSVRWYDEEWCCFWYSYTHEHHLTTDFHIALLTLLMLEMNHVYSIFFFFFSLPWIQNSPSPSHLVHSHALGWWVFVWLFLVLLN